MQRRQLLIGGAAAASAALAGCTGAARNDPGAEGVPDGEGIPDGEAPRTISVSASGETEAEPDLAVLRTGVEATGDDPREVRDEVNERAEALREALLDHEALGEEDVTTDGFDVHERVDRRAMERDGVRPDDPEAEEEYRYYEGTHGYSIEVDDVDAVGEVVDVAIDAGADEIGRIRYTLSDDVRDDLREEAIEEALADAETEAEVVAREIDASIVQVENVDTTGGRVSPVTERYDAEMADVADDAGTDLHPDDVSVSADVHVVFRME